VTRINISGGEPLAHPNFYDILCYCEAAFEDVRVYSNAIKKLHYNTDVIKEVETHAHVCIARGKEVFIPKNADKIHFLKLMNQGKAKDMNPVGSVTMSGDNCKECDHLLLQADGKVVNAPCKKNYEE
jgi:molybdenum cofactor biosynthesis enzyme MoaA